MMLEPDKKKCDSGYTSFSKRIIVVNPTMFDVSPEEQYDLTKAVLCHEAGHRRFTTPANLPSHVHVVSNVLEDERIEKLMEQEFVGVRELLKRLSKELLGDVEPLDPKSDEPDQVLNSMLQLRWSRRLDVPVRGTMSSRNRERWDDVSYLVQEAWTADSSEVCDRNAAEILRILGIGEHDLPEWLRELLGKLEVVEGARGANDRAEKAAPEEETAIGGTGGWKPFDGEPLPVEHGVDYGSHIIEPKPYLELMEKAQPMVRRLVEELSVEESAPMSEPSERGGRLSVRQHLRDTERPFITQQEDRPSAPTMTFRLIIDHSTSMNHERRIEYAAQAAMMLHLAGVELGIPHQIIVTPDDIGVADLETGETGLARIAGIVPALSGYESTGLAVSLHGQSLQQGSEDIKLLMVIHDGMGNDHELLKEACQHLRNNVVILGIGLGMGEMEEELLKEQFGHDRYIHCASPEELPSKIGTVIRSVRGV
jgi:hypothetical protein